MEEQLSKKGKDPHFGVEKILYKLQEQLLGPLTCLWSEPIRLNGKPTKVRLLQRDLVQVGSTSKHLRYLGEELILA